MRSLRTIFTGKTALVKFTKKKYFLKKQQPTRQVNVTRFASKRYSKQFCNGNIYEETF